MKTLIEHRRFLRRIIVEENAKRSALKIQNIKQRDSFRTKTKINSPIRLTEAPYLSEEHQTERFFLIHSEPVLQGIKDRINFAFSKTVTVRTTEEEIEFKAIGKED